MLLNLSESIRVANTARHSWPTRDKKAPLGKSVGWMAAQTLMSTRGALILPPSTIKLSEIFKKLTNSNDSDNDNSVTEER